jgi:hypothetical protein
MTEQEKFDDLLRSKLEGRDFPFDETNWDKAEEAIDRSEKKRRYGIIALIFAAGIGVGIAVMLPFINNTKSPGTVTPQPSQQAVAANSLNPGNTITANSGVQSQAQQTVTGNSSTVTQATTPQNNTPGKKNQKVSADSAKQYSYVRPASERRKKRKGQTGFSPANNAAITYTRTHDENSPWAKSGKADNTTEQNNNTQSGNTSEVSSAGANKTPNTTSQAVQQNNNTTSVSKQADSTHTSPPIAINDTANKKRDSSATTTLSSNTPPPAKPAKYSHTLLSLDAGAGYSLGWEKEGGKQGNGLSPVFGISATHNFSKTISVFAGVQFNSLTNINTLYSNSSTQYDFGSYTNVNSVTLKTLYYMAIPLKIQYTILTDNIISLGITPLYLVNTSSTVVSYQQNYYGVSGNTAATKPGYMDGINPWDAQLTLAYRRKINHFTVSAEYYYGLLDIENNSFFENNVFERNSGFRLLLSFDIIK